MKARAIIETDDDLKADALSTVPDRQSWSWRDMLYELGFKPTFFDPDVGERFPTRFEREWQGHQIVIDYLYAVRQWSVRVDGKPLGGTWQDVDALMRYLHDEVIVANLDTKL